MRVAVLFPLVLLGCESGLSESYTLTVGPQTSGEYSPEAPGLLRVQTSTHPAVLALCGQTLEPHDYSVDLGFGCLDELRDTQEERSAWVEPMPASWSAQHLCNVDPPRFQWDGLILDEQVTNSPDPAFNDLADAPEPGWPTATSTGTWRRDGSPCGGVLPIELAFP